MHKPVLSKEVIENLNPKNGDIILDATVGCGGHAELIMKQLSPHGLLIGIDRDDEALVEARTKLRSFNSISCKIVKENFRNLDSVLRKLGIEKVNGVLFDVGISSLQLDTAYRGFSVHKDGPLDMRMDKTDRLTARDVVNKYPKDRLYEVIKAFSDERYARKIASFIVDKRTKKPFETTAELVATIKRAVGYKYRRLRIHPATRTFQAIRIEVNQELSALSEALEKLVTFLASKARICVISFHSLEDRIVKNLFKRYSQDGIFRLINKKPIMAGREEVLENPRSRSAKMRVAEFLG